MPLTKKGKKVLHKMESQYGKKKGKSVFYATMHKKPMWAKKMHK